MSTEDRVRALMTANEDLDDVKRARLWARLDARLPAEGAHPPVRARWRWALPTGGALAAAAAIAVWLGRGGDAPRALVAPADATLTAMVGPYARVAIVGPARVEVEAVGETSSVRVRSGTMLAEFAGGAGRSLHVAAPGLEVEVVGTLFAVAVDGSSTCVSVAHGRVRVTTAAGIVMVGGDERTCTGDARPHSIEPSTRDALLRHEQLIAAADHGERKPAISVQPIDPPAIDPSTSQPSTAPSAAITPPVITRAPAADATASPAHAQPTAVVHAPTPAAIAHAPAITPTRSPTIAHAPVIRHAPAQPTAIAHTPLITPSPAAQVPSPAAPHPPPVAVAREPSAEPPVEHAPSPSVITPAPPTHAPSPAPPAATIASHPPSPVRPAEPITADSLYRDAEAALTKGDVAAADRALGKIIDGFSSSALFDQALYERARLAYQRHAWSQARRDLDQLAGVHGSALAEPGQYLGCRVALAAHDADVARCFAAYRTAYPRSPHALDVLALLVELAHADGGCRAAEPLIGELVRDHREAAQTRAWRTRCPVPR